MRNIVGVGGSTNSWKFVQIFSLIAFVKKLWHDFFDITLWRYAISLVQNIWLLEMNLLKTCEFCCYFLFFFL